MRYQLYYWSTIQGRGEFVRLAPEEAGAPYVDVARTRGGTKRMQAILDDARLARPPFAPPFLKAGTTLVAQTANILHGQWLVGARVTYADLSLFQVVAGLSYACPRAMQRLLRAHPRVVEDAARVAVRPRIAAYLASPRRIPFDEEASSAITRSWILRDEHEARAALRCAQREDRTDRAFALPDFAFTPRAPSSPCRGRTCPRSRCRAGRAS